MKLPRTFKVLGFDWKISENADVAFEGNVYGTTHHQTQQVFIEPKLSLQKQEQTILHELMHAIWWQSGLGKRYDKEQTKIEEEVVHTLSMGLYQVLKDNNLTFK